MEMAVVRWLQQQIGQASWLSRGLLVVANWGLFGLVAITVWTYIGWSVPAAELRGARRRAATAMVAALLATGLSRIVELFLYRPRPFVANPDIRNLLSIQPSGAFPSEHATALLALASVLGSAWSVRTPIAWLLALGAAVSRVFAGAHYPSDVLAGGAVGWLVGHLLWRRRQLFLPAVDAATAWVDNLFRTVFLGRE